jgi:hypothetical protein
MPYPSRGLLARTGYGRALNLRITSFFKKNSFVFLFPYFILFGEGLSPSPIGSSPLPPFGPLSTPTMLGVHLAYSSSPENSTHNDKKV